MSLIAIDSHKCNTDNECHNLNRLVTEASQRCHNLPNGANLTDLSDVLEYLTKGGCPLHLRHWIVDVLIEKTERQDEQRYRTRKLKYDVDEFLSVTTGDFSVTEVYQGVTAVTKQDKAAIRQILHRLAEKGILKKQGVKAGIYRVIEDKLDPIDWQNATDDEFPLILPLNIHEWVKIQPKNIIVVAGSANSGKTAFLLNIVKDNMYKYNINYFSSEMSENEFKERIVNFGNPLPDQWKFNVYNRCSNFQDVIEPNSINIIDFLELHDEFWKVGKLMLEIYEKLDKGIAVIALQKMKGAKTGRGGDFTLEKPRLYISMENGSLCLEKAKNWRHKEHNPNNLQVGFKLVQGCKFTMDIPWDYRRG